MKQIKFLFATIMAVVFLTTFSSCSDEKDEPAVPAAKQFRVHTPVIWNVQ